MSYTFYTFLHCFRVWTSVHRGTGCHMGYQGDLQQEMASFLSIARSQGRRSRQIQELEHREKVLLTAMETIETIGHWAESAAIPCDSNFCWGKHGKTMWKIREAVVQVQLMSGGTSPFQAIRSSFFSHTFRLDPLDWKRQISSNIKYHKYYDVGVSGYRFQFLSLSAPCFEDPSRPWRVRSKAGCKTVPKGWRLTVKDGSIEVCTDRRGSKGSYFIDGLVHLS